MKIISPLIASLIFFTACSNAGEKEMPAGGACSYRSKIFPARLVMLERKDSLGYEALFEIGRDYGKKDTVSYFRQYGSFITEEKRKQAGIDTGTIWQYKVDDIISGSCNGHIEKLYMQRYVPAQ